jgi:Flp pilus assembly protein TadB
MEHHRRAQATAAANKYTPHPEGNALTYGVVAVTLVYSLRVLAYPMVLGVALVPVFALGVLVRHRRRRQHINAVDQEVARQDDLGPVE